MSSAIDLVVLNGPAEGDVIRLSPTDELQLGRSARGVQVIDPLVSMEHASISWEGDRYWIEDLRSATGTYINDERVTDRPECLVPGSVLKIGETEFSIVERKQSAVGQVGGVVAVALLVVVVFFVGRELLQSIEAEYSPSIRWYQQVRQGGGKVDAVVDIPVPFVRRTGVDDRGLRIEAVTDHNGDGIDELWLKWSTGRELVTFDGRGGWVSLSPLPPACEPATQRLAAGLPAECYADRDLVKTELPAICATAGLVAQGFPDLDCEGALYRFDEGVGYHPIAFDGVVAWMPPTEEVNKPEPKDKERMVRVPAEGAPVAYRFTLATPATLSGFLSERGIDEPVHYLVCEEALSGVAAQVLTASGELKQLTHGCINAFSLDGSARREEFLNLMPKAFAFTGAGYEALLDDFAVHYSGSTNPLFANRRQRKAIQQLSKPAMPRLGAIRVAFNGSEGLRSAIAPERRVAGTRTLLRARFAEEAPRPAEVALIQRKLSRYDPPGCAELEVRLPNGWHCALPGCQESQAFASVRNTGCGGGPLRKLSFNGTSLVYKDAHVNARLEIETAKKFGQVDVLRARIGWTEPEEEKAPEPQ